MSIQNILQEPDVNIIDVRERFELLLGKIKKSVNMPLSRIGEAVPEIKKMQGKKVFYCRSGNRSGQAVNYLKSQGIKDVYNGGSLSNMKSYS